MKLGHEQIEVDLKHLDTVSTCMMPGAYGAAMFWQVKILMLDGRMYHENFDCICDAADRVIEIRDCKINRLENKLDDLMAVLVCLPDYGEQIDAILCRQDT